MKNKCVYALLDPRKQLSEDSYLKKLGFEYEPFYIGKGKILRPFSHISYARNHDESSSKLNKIRKIEKEEKEVIIVYLFCNISNAEANKIEIQLIKLIGRISENNGPLTNLTDGGEGTVNYKHSEQSKKRIGEKVSKSFKNPETLKKLSESRKKLWMNEEYRKVMKESKIKAWQNPDFIITMKKIRNEPEFKKNQSETTTKNMLRLWQDKDFREMMTEKRKTQWTPELKQNYSEIQKEMWANPEYRQKMLDQRNTKEYKEKLSKACNREKRSKISKEMWKNSEYRENFFEKRSNKYKITLINGEVLILRGKKEVKPWCEIQGFSFSTFKRHIGKTYRGFLFEIIS